MKFFAVTLFLLISTCQVESAVKTKTKTVSRVTVSPSTDSAGCCTASVYPEGKVWITKMSIDTGARGASDTRSSLSAGQRQQQSIRGRTTLAPRITSSTASINYTLYDPYGIVTKVWAYEVDPQATIVTNRKVFEADVADLKCPKGYSTSNPEHKTHTKQSSAQTLCLQQAGQKLSADKWYAICRERTCKTCHLDKIRDTQKYPEYIKIESAKVVGNKLVVQINVLEPGMRYNVSLEVGAAKESLTNATILPTQTTTTIEIPNFTQNVYRYPTYVNVVPWPKSTGLGCSIAARKQLTILPPVKKAGALSRE